jgi:hypothetical protein
MMTRTLQFLAAGAVSLAGLAVLWSPTARSQINAAPSWTPIGVSASGNASTVWFHEPSTRQTAACQTVAAPGSGLSGIQCVATKLP